MTPPHLPQVRNLLAALLLAAASSTALLPLTAPAPASGAVPTVGTVGTLPAADEPEGGFGRMMLVLDSSGSMAEPAGGGDTKIAAAKSALRTIVRDLPGDAQVGLRVFGAEVFSRTDPGSCADTQQVVAPGTDNRSELLDAIGDYEPYGETPIPTALREAAQDLGSEGSRSIVLVSDGESTCQPDPCEVAAELAEQNINLQIDVVGLSVSGDARDQLQCVADRGNGTYYDADDADDIEAQLTRVAERAIRPFTLTGERIEGGTPESPTAVTVGDWIDRLGPQGSDAGAKTYAYDKSVEGSTLRVSAITQGQVGDEGLRVEVFDPTGAECDTGNSIRQIDAREIVGVQATASADDGCDAAGTYTITVSRRLGDDQDVRFGLRVAEEPPVEDPGYAATSSDVEVTAPRVSGRPQDVVGGSSFANATPLVAGSYRTTIVPGEALLFSVPLEFGQGARIAVTYPEATGSARDTIGLFAPLSEIALYNPMQAGLTQPSDADFSGSAGREDLTLLTAVPQVSRDLSDLGGFNGIEDYSMAGDYYLGISLMRQDYSVEFPVVIDVEVVGDPAAGPTYADDATWTVADGAVYPDVEPTTDPTSEPADEQTSEPTDEGADGGDETSASSSDDGGASTPIAAVAGALGVLAVIGALVLWRRTRRA